MIELVLGVAPAPVRSGTTSSIEATNRKPTEGEGLLSSALSAALPRLIQP
jgi:hypothetical protein